MKSALLAAGASLLALAAIPAQAQDAEARAEAAAPDLSAPALEFTEWTLDNGLRVIAMPDDTTGMVYTSMWYDVGSKNDPEGRSGFAHLFEHILSRKTENMPYNLIYSLTADVGGTRNASTGDDRTNYYELVPAEYLEQMLWTHKERMALPVVDEQVFESERGVVKEEFRTRVASQPYGPLIRLVMSENGYDNSPMRRSTIGSIEQLDAAKLGDALAFHEAYYGPDTATLIVAGNFKTDDLRALVDTYFSDIPRRANPLPTKVEQEKQDRTAPRLVEATNPNVPMPVVGSLWEVPSANHPDYAALNLLDSILGSGQSNRLQDALVRSGKAVDKFQRFDASEDGGNFATLAFVSPAADLAEVEAIIAAEIARVRTDGVTQAELTEAKNEIFASRLSSRQTASGRASELGEAMMQSGGDPYAADKKLAAMTNVTVADVQRVARTWLDPNKRVDIRYTSGPADPAQYKNPAPMPELVTPPPASKPPLAVLAEGEREAIPGPGTAPEVAAPEIAVTRLANGADVVAARTGNLPMALITAVLPGGTIIDKRETAGLSAMAASLAEQGTSRMDAATLAAAFESLGANFSVSPGDEGAFITVYAPTATIEQAGALMVEVLRDAAYPADQVEIQKARTLQNITSLRSNPGALAGIVSPPILYGDAPYGNGGSEASIAAITPDALRAYREKWWRPDTMKLIVSGGLDTDESIALVNRLFGGWQASGPAPELPSERAGPARAPRTVVVDLPEAGQAAVTVAVRAPSRSSADYFPLSIGNAILGGGSSGRLFEEIRTKRSLSYGAYSGQPGRVDEAFLTASSQTDNQTADEVAAILLAELDRLGTDDLPQTLVDTRRQFLLGSNERQMETAAGFNTVVAGLLQNGLPPQDAARYAEQLGAVTPEQVKSVAQKYVTADRATLIIVGDSKFFLDDLRKIRPDVTVVNAADLDLADPLGELTE